MRQVVTIEVRARRTEAWMKLFSALVFLGLISSISLIAGVFTLRERDFERVFTFMFPLPHLLLHFAPFGFHVWPLASAQVLGYSALIGFLPWRFMVVTIAMIGFHFAAVALHLAIRMP